MAQQVYIEHLHTDKSGDLTALCLRLHYGHAQADITIHPASHRSVELGLPEVARLEIHMLIDALEAAAKSSSNILPHPQPKT